MGRSESHMYVTGRGGSLHMACKLVQMLKRQKVCVVDKVSTGMSMQPIFTSGSRKGPRRSGGIRWHEPSPMIVFKLSRGEFAELLSGGEEKAIIAIFERLDPSKSGYVSFGTVRALKFEETFCANKAQVQLSEDYLASLQLDEEQVNLPQFLRYASLLIHPLLKPDILQKMLAKASESELPPDAP